MTKNSKRLRRGSSPEKLNRYDKIIEDVFFSRYRDGAREVPFRRTDFEAASKKLGIPLPKNLGDLVYSYRYRANLPDRVSEKAPSGKTWIIVPKGKAEYCFELTRMEEIKPNPKFAETKIPDATPGVVEKYASDDEQALLAKLRYNRLIDIFTGLTCYSLQNHLRTTVIGMGQVETDEIYVGLDKKGVHYVIPIQAKRKKDSLSIVQIKQDFGVCREKFPELICRPVAAQFMEGNVIALFEFEESKREVRITSERHYRLVPPEDVVNADLGRYKARGEGR